MKPYWGEFIRYKVLLDGALEQIDSDVAFRRLAAGENSIAVILRHLAGNFNSRFTNFLTTDGEKEWRDREGEFKDVNGTLEECILEFEGAWKVIEKVATSLDESHMGQKVCIRGVQLRVDEALARSLAHFAYHVGEIVLLAKHWKGNEWRHLSIPPGGTKVYNQSPNLETGVQQFAQRDAATRCPKT